MKIMIPLFAVLLIAVVAGVICFANRRWRAGTRALRGELEAARRPVTTHVFELRELESLPAPVQRYFRAALAEGLRVVTGVAIEQTGAFNQSETNPAWKPFTAAQRVFTRRPGYVWDARIRAWPGVMMHVRDAYVAGEGILQAALFGLFPVADLHDSGELAQGELMRYFAEAAWYPTALLPSQGVPWAAVDDHSARATLVDGTVTVELLFRFNSAGLIDSVRAEARGRVKGAVVEHLPWECRLWHYAARSGMHVPLEGEVAWIHPEGAKPYWRGRITRLAYEFAR